MRRRTCRRCRVVSVAAVAVVAYCSGVVSRHAIGTIAVADSHHRRRRHRNAVVTACSSIIRLMIAVL